MDADAPTVAELLPDATGAGPKRGADDTGAVVGTVEVVGAPDPELLPGAVGVGEPDDGDADTGAVEVGEPATGATGALDVGTPVVTDDGGATVVGRATTGADTPPPGAGLLGALCDGAPCEDGPRGGGTSWDSGP